ncbi:MAG: hypothetical protein K8J08_11125 [Thermoanaerobaculia bacterium]|nr:hypothetical protein [Thermoanaerobaculia bacterium]
MPVCERHEVADSIRLEKWRANATELAFSFSQSDYARHFSWANENNDSGGREMPSGRRFIVYSYVFSAVYFSASLRSRVFAIGEVDSRVVPGIRYSLLTFITGWWAVAGIFLSIDALAQNFRGGTDVTDLARRAFEGVPVSAYGVK